MLILYLFARAAAGLLALSTIVPARASDEPSKSRDTNAGFYLLHKLFDDESHLDILLDLKHSPQSIQDFANQISKAADSEVALLDKIRDADPKVSWDKNPLPKFEQDVRSSIAGEKQHQLLFGTSNDDFVRALLISQAEATSYASNLTKVMSQRDISADQQRIFARMSERWHALYEKDLQLLKNY